MKKLQAKVFSAGWWIFFLSIPVSLIIFKLLSLKLTSDSILKIIFYLSILELIYLRFYKASLKFVEGYNYNYFNELPLYLCNIGTILCIYAAATGNRYCMAYCTAAGSVGSMLAIFMPDPNFVSLPFFSMRAFGFFGYHAMLAVTSWAFMVTGIYHPEFGDIIPVIIICLASFVFAYLVNELLRKTHLNDEANYIFTHGPQGNPVLAAVRKKIDINFIYLMPLVVVFAIVATIMFALLRLVF